MSDGNRQRPAIDLDDLERQLRAVAQPKAARPLPPEPAPFVVKPVFAAPPAAPMSVSGPENESFAEPEFAVEPPAPKPAPRVPDYDPLAELARIAQSGSDWSAPRGSEAPSSDNPAPATSAVDALEALLRMDPPVKAPPPSFAPLPPRRREPDFAEEAPEQPSLDFALEQPAEAYAPEQAAPAYAQAAAEAEPIYAPEGQLPPHDEGFIEEEPRPRRTGLKLAVALVGVAAIGVGGVVYMRDGQGLAPGGGPRTPPVIKASNEPAKVAPQNPGGMEVPNANQEIFAGSKNTTGPAAPSKVVTTEEQPVDVNQAAKPVQPRVILPNGGSAATVPPAAPPPVSTVPREKPGTTASAGTGTNVVPQPNGVAALGEPKKVRTVSVRPDGTVIDGSEPVKAPSMAVAPTVAPSSPVPTQTLPAAAAAPPATGAPLPAIAPASPVQTASAPAAAPAPQTAADAAPQPAPAGTPLPPRRPVIAAAPQAAADPQAQPGKPAPAAPAAPAPTAPAPAPAQTASVGTGDFAVQLAAPPTEQEAKSLASRLAQRYGDALAGQEPDIIRAEVNGKTLYRVRVTGLDRESANTMCNRIKSAQGSCFVAKN